MRILVLHSIEHHGSLQGGLIAERDVRVPVGDFQENFADCPPISFGQIWEFFDYLGCAHGKKLDGKGGVVRGIFSWFSAW